MKTFNYTARGVAGNEVKGTIEAETRDEAVDHLRADNLVVVDISGTTDANNDIVIGGKKVKEKNLAIMCNQFSIILAAGMPIVRTLELVANQTEDAVLKPILEDVAHDVAAGYPMADSFTKYDDILPTTFIETIRAGEESGGLDTSFRRLSNYYTKSSRTKDKVSSAMVYPAFVMVVAVVVVAVIMIMAVPTFKVTFESMGTELPLPTQILIGTSDFMTAYWWVIVTVIVAIIFGIKLAKRNEDFHLWWSYLGVSTKPSWPNLIRNMNRMNNSAQFASTMSTMIAAGLSVIDATDVTSRVLTNYWMGQQLASIRPELESGKTLYSCLVNTEAFPELVCEMTSVGEQTGSLEHTLDVLSEYYDNEVETATAKALAAIEPITIIILAVFVVFILLSVYLPMFGMYSAMGT